MKVPTTLPTLRTRRDERRHWLVVGLMIGALAGLLLRDFLVMTSPR